MKTRIVIDLLRYWGNHCDAHISNGEYQVEGSVLLKNAASKIERLCEDVSERNEKIGKLKKNNRKLRKDLAEREAAPGWISVEERLPEEEGKIYFILFADENQPMASYFGCGRFTHENVAYWMPLPAPPKKVKTYTDVFWERMKEVFPDFTNKDPKPSYCRPAMFGEDFNLEYICGKMKDCEDCWNQPYPEEEGGEE